MYNCKKCGHALSSNSALCPNCGAMMDNRQLEIRKGLKNNNSAYLDRLDAIRSRNIMNKNHIYTFLLYIILCSISISFYLIYDIVRRKEK